MSKIKVSRKLSKSPVTLEHLVPTRLVPARGLALVHPIETEETMPGGRIVVPAGARERLVAQQAEIVAIGEPEICEEEDCERNHC